MPLQNFSLPLSQISAKEFAERREDCDGLQLIDVREPEELAIAHVEGFINLPLSQFDKWAEQINQLFDPSIETVVMCHHGMRSAQMCYWLMDQGFTNVRNLVGGIDAYSEDVDGSIPQY
ncbi:MAG TPA: rhodanese-like domain-containing protein [Crinalium sp.]|jgi:rhodanese-related sulfurtransferase